jgi:hypothetical protein
MQAFIRGLLEALIKALIKAFLIVLLRLEERLQLRRALARLNSSPGGTKKSAGMIFIFMIYGVAHAIDLQRSFNRPRV